MLTSVIQKDLKTIYIKDNKEYYKNADGKIVSRSTDESIGYREYELHPKVIELLEECRAIYNYPTKALIDAVIKMQHDSIDKACFYIKYQKLGQATYLDVFGKDAQKKWEHDKHVKQNEQMEKKLDMMAAQMKDMQQLMFNMAQMNNVTVMKRTG